MKYSRIEQSFAKKLKAGLGRLFLLMTSNGYFFAVAVFGTA